MAKVEQIKDIMDRIYNIAFYNRLKEFVSKIVKEYDGSILESNNKKKND